MLPASTWAERDEIRGRGATGVGPRLTALKKLIEPLWESKDDVYVFQELLKRVGLDWGYSSKVEMLDGEYVSDKFFYIEPTFNGEVNIMNWFRINAGVGYFWVDNIQGMPGLSSSDVRGITGTIVFKFGWF